MEASAAVVTLREVLLRMREVDIATRKLQSALPPPASSPPLVSPTTAQGDSPGDGEHAPETQASVRATLDRIADLQKWLRYLQLQPPRRIPETAQLLVQAIHAAVFDQDPTQVAELLGGVPTATPAPTSSSPEPTSTVNQTPQKQPPAGAGTSFPTSPFADQPDSNPPTPGTANQNRGFISPEDFARFSAVSGGGSGAAVPQNGASSSSPSKPERPAQDEDDDEGFGSDLDQDLGGAGSGAGFGGPLGLAALLAGSSAAVGADEHALDELGWDDEDDDGGHADGSQAASPQVPLAGHPGNDLLDADELDAAFDDSQASSRGRHGRRLSRISNSSVQSSLSAGSRMQKAAIANASKSDRALAQLNEFDLAPELCASWYAATRNHCQQFRVQPHELPGQADADQEPDYFGEDQDSDEDLDLEKIRQNDPFSGHVCAERQAVLQTQGQALVLDWLVRQAQLHQLFGSAVGGQEPPIMPSSSIRSGHSSSAAY